MLRFLSMVSIAACLTAPVAAQDVTSSNFRPRVLADLVALCGVAADDPLRTEAIHFCHGYVTGAWQYYEALMAGPDAEPFVCPPTPTPSRDQAVEMFLAWAQGQPDLSAETPIEGMYRFLAQTWPCRT